MAKTKTVVLDELHLTLRIPSDLPDDEVEEIRELLAGDEFLSRLREVVRGFLREFTELSLVRLSLTR